MACRGFHNHAHSGEPNELESEPLLPNDSQINYSYKSLVRPCICISLLIGLIITFIYFNLHESQPQMEKTTLLYFIAHAEKIESNHHDLSNLGFQRARYLPHFFTNILFSGAPTHLLSAYPSTIFNRNHPPIHLTSNRPYQTLEPLARIMNIQIETHKNWTHDHYQQIAIRIKEIVASSKMDNRILVCWEHNAIPHIVKELQESSSLYNWGKNPLDSNSPQKNENDLLWVLDFKKSTVPPTVIQQNFIPVQ